MIDITYTLTVDDAGSGGPEMVESFRRTCEYAESRDVRVTWFVVPKPGGEPWSDEWRRAFLEARDAGHDLQRHGLTHGHCFEFGPPVEMGCYNHLEHRDGRPQQAWTDKWPHAPFRWYSGIVEVPLVGEYTWRGAWQQEGAFHRLAKADVDRLAETSSIGVLLAHTHGIGDNFNYAFRTFDAVLEHLEGQGRRRFATMAELADSGAMEPSAETPEGPDLLPV